MLVLEPETGLTGRNGHWRAGGCFGADIEFGTLSHDVIAIQC